MLLHNQHLGFGEYISAPVGVVTGETVVEGAKVVAGTVVHTQGKYFGHHAH